jgi:hypothetical protein
MMHHLGTKVVGQYQNTHTYTGCFELLMSFKWKNGIFDMAFFQDFFM